MNFYDGQLISISNFGITGVSIQGNYIGFVTAASIVPLNKYGVAGGNYTLSFVPVSEGLNISNNLLVFYTLPIVFSKRLTISPDIYISGSSLQYTTVDKTVASSESMSFMTGAGIDYSLTKRFKLNLGLKTVLSSMAEVPASYMLQIGTKLNL
jgi:hypothetical protein